MKISLPTLRGFQDIPDSIVEFVKVLSELLEYIRRLANRGINLTENASYEILTMVNTGTDPAWITVDHNLRRVPLGFLLQSGGTSQILDSQLQERVVKLFLAPGANVRLVLL